MKPRLVFVGAVVLAAVGFAGAGIKLFVDSFVTYAEPVPWADGYHLLASVEPGAELPSGGTLVFMASSVIGVVTEEMPPKPDTAPLLLRNDVHIPGDSRFELRRISDRPAIVVVPGPRGVRMRPWEEARLEAATPPVTPRER